MAEIDSVTEVTVRLGAKMVENFNSRTIEVTVSDRVRPGVDKTTGEAIDRIYNLVEAKIDEKLAEG